MYNSRVVKLGPVSTCTMDELTEFVKIYNRVSYQLYDLTRGTYSII